MAVYIYLQGVLFVFSICSLYIAGLDVCEDKSNDCQPCNLQYPVPSPTRENCMKTCQVCTSVQNVALNKPAYQVSTEFGGVASNAVDGRIIGDNTNGNFCTHTDQSKPAGTSTHWWCVDLGRMYNLNNVTIYNTVTKWDFRLQGFQLNTAPNGQCNQQGFDRSTPCYRDTPDRIVHIYTVDNCNLQSNKSISAGTIFIWHRRFIALTLCEVQAYIGISCSYGYYSTSGSTCEPCNDGCSDNKCNPDTGDCIGDCKSGFYGSKCNKACSQGCSTSDCKRDGSCTVCKPGWYGDNCESRCTTGCKETCNKTNGACDECKEGTVGLYCDIKCGEECRTMTEEEKRWSICKEEDCSRVCQDKYYGESSEVIISRCNYLCIGGRKSETCLRVKETSVQEKNSEDSISPVTASSISGIVGLIVGVAVTGLICWLCCIRRRQPGDQQDARTDQRRHNNSISTNQPSTIIQNETFLSDQESNMYDTLENKALQNDARTNAYCSLSNN